MKRRKRRKIVKTPKRKWNQFFIQGGYIYKLTERKGNMVLGDNTNITGIGSPSKIKVHEMNVKMIPKKSLSKMYEVLLDRMYYINHESSSYEGRNKEYVLFELNIYLGFVEKLILEKFRK